MAHIRDVPVNTAKYIIQVSNNLSIVLYLDNESNFLIVMSSLFHSLTVEGINDKLVIESTEKNY
jgi:hypothetical protein